MLLRLLSIARADRANTLPNRGFAIAPILYLLGLIGVGAGVLFSGYSQILRSNQSITNSLTTKTDLQGTATTLAASSWLSTDQTLLCPPLVGSNSPTTPSAKCSGAASAITAGTSFASATAGNLPANYASVSSSGNPVEVGVFKAGSGAKVLDPWGHYYVYCRWENPIGTANAIMVISAGANGKVETKCGDTVAGGDDVFVVWTTAVTQNRAAVWQTTTSGTAVTGTQFGATGTQINIDTAGNVSVPGTLAVTGSTTVGTAGLSVTGATNLTGTLTGTTGTFTGPITGASGTFSGNLGVTGTTTLGTVTAGTATVANLGVTNNATVGGTLGVTGAATLGPLTAGSSTIDSLAVTNNSYFGGSLKTGNGVVQIGTSVVATGSSTPLLTVGKAVSNAYPFSVDQFGAITGSSFSGNVNGGTLAGTTLNASGATTLGGTLDVTGAATFHSTVNITGNLTGSTATFSGAVSAASYTGSFALSGGGGPTITGVLPIANGGTGQSSAGSALSSLFGGAGTIPGLIPGADLITGSVTSTQLNATGVTPGTYSSVTVGTDGRVLTGTATSGAATSITDGSGDSVTVGTAGGITYTIGGTVQGNWTTIGLMIGTSKAPLDKLDVYGATAIGTGYAGVTAAPTNGLIVQGQVAIGTSTPNGALNVNGTVSATNFSGSGAGLTSIGTGALSGTIASGNGGTGTNVVFTPGSVVYSGASGVYHQDNANFYYDETNHRLGLGTTAPQSTLSVNGTTSFLFGNDYTGTGSQSDVNLGTSSSVRYNGTATATFYGIAAGANGQIVHLHNASGYILTLSNLSGSETSTSNQIITGTGSDLQVQANSSVILQYDNTAFKWRVIGGSGGAGQGLAGQAAYYQTSGSTVVGTSSIYIVGGNVGIGTATPSSQLHVNGTLHLTGVTGGIGASNGSGIVGGANGNVQFNSSGVFAGDNSLFWDNTNKFLGIGTVVPTVPLQVQGSIYSVNDNAWSAVAQYSYGPTFYGAFRHEKARGSAASPAAVQSGDWLGVFDAYGHDGTGFNTEAAGMVVGAASTWSSTASSRSGYLSFWTTGAGTAAERMRIDQSGNVGIGTTSPLAALHLGASAAAIRLNNGGTANGGLYSFNDANGNVAFSLTRQTVTPGGQTASLLVSTWGDIGFGTNQSAGPNASSVQMVIGTSGNVGIGTQTPASTLTVNGTIQSLTGGIKFPDGTTQTTAASGSATLPALASANIWVGNGSSAATAVTLSGDCTITNAGVITCPKANGVTFGALATAASVNLATQVTGNLPVANLGSGTGASSSTYWRGDGTWAAISGGTLSGGVANYVPLWTSATAIGTSAIYQSGSNVGIGTTTMSNKLDVNGSIGVGTYAGTAAPSGGLIASGPIYSGTNGGDWSITWQGEFRKDQNANTYLGLNNGTSGAGAANTFEMIGGTGNSWYYQQLADNAGSPSLNFFAGSGVSNAYWRMPNYNFQGPSGTSWLYINSSGNVGIGITSPTDPLHVYSTSTGTDVARFENAASATAGVIMDVAGGNWLRFIPDAAVGAYNNITSTHDSLLIFSGGTSGTGNLVIAPWAGATSGIRITSAGNIGIGTTSPGTKLDVLGVIRSNDGTVYTQIAPSSTIGYIGNTSNHPLGLIANNTEYLRVAAAGGGFWNGGNVGIGSTSPATTLDVNGIIRSGAGGFKFPDGTTQTTAAASGLTGGTTNYVPLWTSTTAIGTSSISQSGSNIGIANTSPSYNLDVAGTGRFTSKLDVGGNISALGGNILINNTSPYLQWYESSQAANSRFWDFNSTGGILYLRAVNDAYSAATTAMQVQRSGSGITSTSFPNGSVGIGNTSPTTTLTVQGPGNTTPSLTGNSGTLTINNGGDLQLQVGQVNNGGAGVFMQSKRVANDGTAWGIYLNPLGGGVGIGKTNPVTALDVNGTVLATAFSGSGASLTSLNAGSLSSGTVPTAQLGSGSASSSTYLRGDGTWATPAAALPSLTSTNIWVGNGSNVATAVAPTGDVTISSAGAITVAKIQGTTVSGTTGTGAAALATAPTFVGSIQVGNNSSGVDSIVNIEGSRVGTWSANQLAFGDEANSQRYFMNTRGTMENANADWDFYYYNTASGAAWQRLITVNPTALNAATYSESFHDDAIYINSSGNVGIGKTNPGTALDINGTVTAAGFSGSGASLTGIPLTSAVAGVLPVANGGTGVVASSGSTTAILDGGAFTNGPYTSDWFRVNGGGGIYWATYGGGWYMSDTTWIRSFNGKPMFESAGIDTGAASGINCGGALGGGYTLQVCGTLKTTDAITFPDASTQKTAAGQMTTVSATGAWVLAGNGLYYADAYVSCPTGYVLTGGGGHCSASGGPTVFLIYNEPNSSTQWHVGCAQTTTGSAPGGSGAIGTAMCMKN